MKGWNKDEIEKFKRNSAELLKVGKAFAGSVYVLESTRIKAPAKILFFNIYSLSYKFGMCYASNPFLCKRLNLKETMLKQHMRELENNGFIKCEYFIAKGRRRRIIHINFEDLLKSISKQNSNKGKDLPPDWISGK